VTGVCVGTAIVDRPDAHRLLHVAERHACQTRASSSSRNPVHIRPECRR
jgi:hypothetical protein